MAHQAENHTQNPETPAVFSFSMETEGNINLPDMLREPSLQLFDQLALIHRQAFEGMDEDGWSAATLQDLYQTDGVIFYGCFSQGMLVAFAVVRFVIDECELLTLAVSPKWQGQKIAQTIIDQMFRGIKQSRSHTMFLEVRHDNVAALKVYQNFGFERMGVRRNYYKTRNSDRLDAYTLKKHF